MRETTLIGRGCLVVAALLSLITFAVGPGWCGQQASQPLYIPPQQGDCINTYQVRLMVAASNAGSAYGDFESSRFMVVRKGTNSQNCWLELGQWTRDGHLEEGKRLKCLFVNPLEDGGY